MGAKTLGDWQLLAEKELKRSPDDLIWRTPESIDVNEGRSYAMTLNALVKM